MDNTEEVGPPEDFKQLRVTPTLEDLSEKNPYLRACRIREPYDSVSHYLDVQFRIMREDFMAPLRRGISEYQSSKAGVKFSNSDVRVYKEVIIMESEINKENSNLGFTVSFGQLRNVNWESGKNFTPGGLLLLSCDDFKTIIFAIVSNSKRQELRKGFVSVEPTDQSIVTRETLKNTYTMLESKIFFEPYRVVLSAMQLMDDDNFPMKSYLVEAKSTSRLPQYFGGVGLFTQDDSPWQASQKKKLNSSQFEAFKHALSEEFALIQGPPGTGKTFVALEIVKALLLNKQLWRRHGPIVVVCYTNHALDQFLEGILKHTNSITRIGERSKSDRLIKFTLTKQRISSIKNRTDRGDADARKNLYRAKNSIENTLTELCRVQHIIKYLTAPRAIVPLECINKYCSDETLWTIKSNEDLVKWLIGEEMQSTIYKSNFIELDALPNNKEAQEGDQLMDDNFLELDYEFDIPRGFELIRPLDSINSEIEMINEQVLTLKRNKYLSYYKRRLVFKEIKELECQKRKLVDERENLKVEFTRHPILHPGQQKSQNDHWNKYWSWIQQSYDRAVENFNDLKVEHRQNSLELNKARQVLDLEILKKSDIIGLTTTLAARLHVTLHGLHAPIVIVEEAAEILESHVVCSMTKDCQHVILIGDHKQLRPKPSDYFIGKKFHLEISLFERMVMIRGNCHQLTRQHRMRPEIVNLITPSIYETLENDKTVCEYPDVMGMEKNLFFLNHKNSESKHNEESWANPHEAQFLIKFAVYLVNQGYQPKEITVLSPYMGQVNELTNERNKIPDLEDLYITTVDNYQGEENRIILLSLVRNNGDGNVGFLKEENRVCVALSRAREGLYIMGNMDDLSVKNIIWPEIKKTLEDQKAIGDSLTLQCQNHPEELMSVKRPSDFELLCPRGGCSKSCNKELDCGHVCTSKCHILDREHEDKYKCVRPCTKACPEGHPCPLECWQDCKPCRVPVERKLECGHSCTIRCGTGTSDEYRCKRRCVKTCSEGHPCPLECWQACRPCRVLVRCKLECGHEVNKPCAFKYEKTYCHHKVKFVKPDCGHEFEKACYLPVEKSVCMQNCKKRIESCGHSCVLRCHVDKDPDHVEYKCRKECIKKCKNGHPCRKKCHEECGPCTEIVRRKCGHILLGVTCENFEAGKLEEEKSCSRSCKRKFDCGHECWRRCSEPCGKCPKRICATNRKRKYR